VAHVHPVDIAVAVGRITHERVVHQLFSQGWHIIHKSSASPVLVPRPSHLHWVAAVTHIRAGRPTHLRIASELTRARRFPSSPGRDAHHVDVVRNGAGDVSSSHGIEKVLSINVVIVIVSASD
jgi:hypothetical protein